MKVEDIIFIHDILIQNTGGARGVLSMDALESSITAPFNEMFGEELYPSTIGKAAKLMELLANNHCFRDGNKRTALCTMLAYLLENNIQIELTEEELVEFAVKVAEKRINFDDIIGILNENAIKIARGKI